MVLLPKIYNSQLPWPWVEKLLRERVQLLCGNVSGDRRKTWTEVRRLCPQPPYFNPQHLASHGRAREQEKLKVTPEAPRDFNSKPIF
jgi:hypothetical protein